MPPHGWQPPPPGIADVPPPPYSWDKSPAKARPSLFTIVGVSLAVLLSAAALIVSLVRGGEGQTPVAPTPSSEPTANANTSTADKALCEAIAPLMTESNRDASEWVRLGEQGTPARDAALPAFVEDTKAWAQEAQGAVNDAPDASDFLRRTLQRYIDDLSLYILNVRPGPKQVYDSAAWTDSLVAYGGPKAICGELGIEW